jgi:uncharacterized pyridoxamine 5'-phosphate oxidase family protein/NAD-dependent dihydropyrimidine dehydrogenase PreA subunit
MDAQTCLKKLQYTGVLSFATVDAQGNPQVRCISAIHFEPNALYFFTAQGKAFCQELLRDGRVQILGYTRYKEMIRLSGRATPVPAEEQKVYIDQIFSEQPYLSHVYPGETRRIGRVFCIRDMAIEYFNLGVRPIFRAVYRVGSVRLSAKGFRITDACTGCGACATVCPQQAILPGMPYGIVQAHCLHCGSCQKSCPSQAIMRRTDEDEEAENPFKRAALDGEAL